MKVLEGNEKKEYDAFMGIIKFDHQKHVINGKEESHECTCENNIFECNKKAPEGFMEW